MIFSHLSFINSHTLMPALDALTLESAIPSSTCQTEPHRMLSTPVNFRFSEPDQVMAELQHVGICDAFGNPCPEFNDKEMPIFSNQDENQQIQFIILKFQHFLFETLRLNSPHFTNGESLSISFTLLDLMTRLSNQQMIVQQDGSLSILPPILDVQSFGRGLLEKIGDRPFLSTAQSFFHPAINKERISEWFTLNHVQQQFRKKGRDEDIRFIANGSLPSLICLSNYTVTYLAATIQDLTHLDVYISKLKEKNPQKYQTVENHHVREAITVEFGGLSKRGLIDKPPNQYTILGFDLVNHKPMDLVFVGMKKDGQLSLKYPCLSSLTCWTLSLTQIPHHLSIGCRPFTPSKAIMDLLCETITILDPDIRAWCRFMHEPRRSMQQSVEQDMVQNVFQSKDEFLEKRYRLLNNLSKEILINPVDIQTSDSQYLYYLFEEEIADKYLDLQTQQVDSQVVFLFLFRACQSLQMHASLPDQDIYAIWQKVDEKGWLSLSDTHQPEQHLLIALKKALIDEKVSFQVVSAWMGLLLWLYAPHLATTHCCRSVFRLRAPELGFLPIQPMQDDKIIQTYLAHHPYPSSLQKVQEAMTMLYPFSYAPSPLLPFLSRLHLNRAILLEMAARWRHQSSDLFQRLGLHLHISSLDYTSDKITLLVILRQLFLNHKRRPQDSPELLKIFEKLIPHPSLIYEQALQALKSKDSVISEFDWINLMLQSGDQDLLHLSYSWWKKQENLPREKIPLEIGWQIFNISLLKQPELALSFLQTIHRQHLVSPQQEGRRIIQLLHAYQKRSPKQMQCDLDRLLPLLYFLFEQDPPFRFKLRDNHILSETIEALRQVPFYQTTADYFLLELSRRHCLKPADQTEKWLTRLELSVNQPEQAVYLMSLYQIVMQEGIIDRTTTTRERVQCLQIALGESLLKAHQKKLSLALFEHLSQEEKEVRAVSSFYEWTLNLLIEESHSSHSFPLTLLNLLLLATPPHKRGEAQEKFRLTFTHKIAKLREKEPTTATTHFSEIDQFLIRAELKPFINQAEEEWKMLLFDYLEASLSLDFTNRFPALWMLYEQLMSLMNKTHDTKQSLRLFKLTTLLLQHSLQPPPSKSLEWIKQKHSTLLAKFRENQLSTEATSLILNLDRHGITHGSLAFDVWRLAEHELTQTSPSAFRLKQLISMENFDNLIQQISLTSYFQVPLLIACLQPLLTTEELLPWLNFYFNTVVKETSSLPELTDEKQRAQLNEAFLICAEQSIEKKNWTQTFQVLKQIPAESHPQRLQAFWKSLIMEWQTSASVETLRELLLGAHVRVAFNQEEDQIHPLAIQAIQRCLNSSSSTMAERRLAFDLIKAYDIHEEALWLLLWKSLKSPLDPEEKILAGEVWESFKMQPFKFKHSLISAECWTLALILLYDIKHKDLILYYEDTSWISTIFNDPLSTSLRWQALEVVFVKAVHQLSSSEFDKEAFNQLIKKKRALVSAYRTQNPNMTPTDLNQLTKWESTIELALVKHLQYSRHPACLLAISQFLQPFLQQSSIHLPYFQQIVTHYMTLNKKARLVALKEETALEQVEQAFWTSLSSSLEALYTQEMTSREPLVSLLNVLTEHAPTVHTNLQIRLCMHVMDKGTVKEIEKLKTAFLALLSTLLTSPDAEELETARKLLEKAFSLMGLSIHEKSKCSYQFLKATYDHTLKDPSGDPDDTVVKKLLIDYQEWAPYLFAHADYLQEMLKRSLQLVYPYARLNPSNRANIDQFTQNFKSILNTKNQVKLPSSPYYQSCLKQYPLWVIHSIQKMKPIKSTFLLSLQEYINETLGKRPPPPHTEMIELLRTLIYLYPLEPGLHVPTSSKIEVIDLSHSGYAKSLLKKFYQKGIFKNHQQDLMEFELYLNVDLNQQSMVSIEHKEICEKILNRFLSDNTSYGLYRAFPITSHLQAMLVRNRQSHLVMPYYEKLFQALQQHIRNSHQIEPLFDRLIQHILYNYPDQDKLASQRQITKIFPLFWKAARQYLDECLKYPVDHFQLYYLDKCLTLLQYQFDHEMLINGYTAYCQVLEELMPLVKKVETSVDRKPLDQSFLNLSKKWQEILPSSTILTQHWTDRLLQPTVAGGPATLTTREQQLQRELLKEWLRCLRTIGRHDDPLQVCDNLIFALIKVITPNLVPSSPWLDAGNPEDKELFESIRALINHVGENRHQLAFTSLSFQFYAHHTKDFELFLKNVEEYIALLEKCTVKQESFPLAQDWLDLLLAEPKNPSVYFSKRQALFLRFFGALKTLIPKSSGQSLIEAQELLMKVLERGIDQKFLDEKYPLAREYFIWAKQNLDRSYTPSLNLLSLIFQGNSLYKTQKKYYLSQISGIMQDVGAYMIQKNDLMHSRRLINLIINLPLSQEEHILYLELWHKVYLSLRAQFEDQVNFNLHLQYMVQLRLAYILSK